MDIDIGKIVLAVLIGIVFYLLADMIVAENVAKLLGIFIGVYWYFKGPL